MNIEITLVLLIMRCHDITPVRVKVVEGLLEGQMVASSTGTREFYSFKGIPYAEPPVGELRFKAPRPPLRWEGIKDATEHGSVCVQYESVTSNSIIGDENCLFLNVYSPDLSLQLPVMVFIHGGLFFTGSGNDDMYAADFLMDYGVVLVTINYRLDVFGFLAANIEEVPGNAGLKDQIAALQWVQRNIRNFGGDPMRVTIMGNSAGGASVSLHMVSPAAKGLFQRAISMSGVWLNDFSISFEPEKRAFKLGQILGLNTSDPYTLIEFLRKLPAKRLILERPVLLLSDQPQASIFSTIYFTPVVENKFGNGAGQFLTQCPLSLMRSRQVNRADLLIGYTALEGLSDVSLVEDNFLKYYPNFKELLVPLKISYYRSPKTVLNLADKIQDFYFGNQSISVETIKELVMYHTYSHIVYDIHSYIENLNRDSSTGRYFYEFAIYSTRNVFSAPGAAEFGINKATHMDDLPYLFDGKAYNLTVDVNGQAFQYVQLMCELFTNFVKYGTPTPDNSLGLVWPQYEPSRSAVRIGETGDLSTLTVSYSTNTSIGFWHQLYRSAGFSL